MFQQLLESQPRRQSWGQAVVSVLAHGVILLAAVEATQSAAATVHRRPFDQALIYVPPAEPAATSAAAPRSPAHAAASIPAPVSRIRVVVPVDVPDALPLIELEDKPFDLRHYVGADHAGGSGLDHIGGGGGSGLGLGDGVGGDNMGGGGPFGAGDLDDPVQVVSIPDPHYPPALRALGVDGVVDLKYVVDTAGRAERESFQVLNRPRPEFIVPAEDAIMRGRFKPARFRGHPVRQWVQQRVRFQIGP